MSAVTLLHKIHLRSNVHSAFPSCPPLPPLHVAVQPPATRDERALQVMQPAAASPRVAALVSDANPVSLNVFTVCRRRCTNQASMQRFWYVLMCIANTRCDTASKEAHGCWESQAAPDCPQANAFATKKHITSMFDAQTQEPRFVRPLNARETWILLFPCCTPTTLRAALRCELRHRHHVV